MSTFNFKQPVRPTAQSTYVFKDVHFDLQEDTTNVKLNKTDIKVDHDTNAIKNSIRNMFNTKKGERILYPEFGMNIEKYLFEPLSVANGNMLGEDILASIKNFESRVTPLNINVYVREDYPGYQVDIVLFINKLNITVTLKSDISSAGFSVN